jgi:hypothetical protein
MKTVALIFISILLLVVSCKKENRFIPHSITPILIGKGIINSNENIPQQNTVINTQAEFNVILNKLDSYLLDTFTETNVDFNNYTVLAVFDTIKPDCGYYITVSNVMENTDNVTVEIVKGYTVCALLTEAQPFHIVKIPKTTKPIMFQ